MCTHAYTCHRFKKRYAGEYEGMSTSELAGDLRRDVEHYRGLWRTARSADAKVRNAAPRKKAKTKAMAS